MTARSGQRIRVAFDVEFAADMQSPSFGLSLMRTDDHLALFEASSTRLGWNCEPVRRGDRLAVSYDLDLNVGPGEYSVGLHVRDRDALKYAAQVAHAAHILVDSSVSAGGVLHLSPAFNVTKSESLPAGQQELVPL